MKIRRIRIWLSRGWYRVVYSVSFLVLSLLCSCSSSRTAAKEKTGGSKGVEASKGKEPADSTKTGVSVINMEDFQGLGIETPDIRLMYGVSRPVLEKENMSGGDEMTEVLFNTNSGQTMRLMYGVQPPENSSIKYPLVVLDGNIVGVDKEKLADFDFEKDIHSREKVAALLGVRKRKVVASRLLESTAATTIWGMRAINGCLDVVTKKQYIPELSRENPDGYYQPLK
jgi:hypothetical protein